MKVVLAFVIAFSGNLLSAAEDDTTYDTNYRLYDVQPVKMVDTSVRLIVNEAPEPLRNPSDEWVTGPLNDGPRGYGSNYDSIHNINPKVAGFISVCFLSFVAYIIFRVRRSIKKDQSNSRR